MYAARRLRHVGVLCFVLGGLSCSVTLAADVYPLAVKAEPLPAVDGFNAKMAGFGGATDGRALYGSEGSITIPLGFRYGLQVDGLAGGYDSPFGRVTTTGAAGHLFWRDPAIGLVSAYGHYFHADVFGGANLYAGGAGGALYWGRFTLEGNAGFEGGKVDVSTLGSVNFSTRFFDVAFLSYYPTDNLKLSIGHSYQLGTHALRFRAEWGLPIGGGTMASWFASGAIREGGDASVLSGLRIYFGQRDKSLIRRHREDDPYSILSDSISSIAVVNRDGLKPQPLRFDFSGDLQGQCFLGICGR
jgi:hypothetical protein